MDSNTVIATIHFIGLALFSTQVPGEEGSLRVLLPRIEESQQVAQQVKTHSGGTGTVLRRIESHVAAIVYRERDVLQEIDWVSEPVPGHMLAEYSGAYRMVRLDGERVTFVARGDNPPLGGKVDLQLPRPTCGTSFRPKFEVAGKIAIPGGELSSCVVGSQRRYDTRLTLKNNSIITVWAESETASKAIVLRGDATVYVTNMPMSTLHNASAPAGMNTSHYLAYYKFFRSSKPDCMRALQAPEREADDCPRSPLLLANGSAMHHESASADGDMFIAIVNSECSNSTWP